MTDLFDSDPPIQPGLLVQTNLVGEHQHYPDWFHVGKYTPGGQKRNVASGLHPLGFHLKGGSETCGGCGNRVNFSPGANSYLKCKLKLTSSSATDIRAKWPACELWIQE